MRIHAYVLLSGLAVVPALLPSAHAAHPGALKQVVTQIHIDGFEDPAPPVFIPDAGIRIDNASNAKAGIDGAGVVYLYYEDRIANGPRVATSVDGLAFAGGQAPTNWTAHPGRVQVSDGTWRRYQLTPQFTLTSESSADGIAFTPEAGVRYSPAPADNGTMGIYDIFATGGTTVVMLYVGDLPGLNNVRRAVSTNNGVTFTYDRGNILGDAGLGGGGNSYVDIESRPLPDGTRRLTAMRGGMAIYSFRIDAAGNSATQETGARVQRTDWTEFTVNGLFDPTVIRLTDGRYRMYVTGQLTGRQAILSATTP